LCEEALGVVVVDLRAWILIVALDVDPRPPGKPPVDSILVGFYTSTYGRSRKLLNGRRGFDLIFSTLHPDFDLLNLVGTYRFWFPMLLSVVILGGIILYATSVIPFGWRVTGWVGCDSPPFVSCH
jgi:hypothetical protein